jgi:ParB-like chromosome segregation protein Spo0J
MINIDKTLEELKKMGTDEMIEAINQIKIALHEISPLKNEPVDCVLWIKNQRVIANDYNPNSVAPPEMDLLRISISNDGYTQPVVTYPENNHYTVVDGFHRTRVSKECEDITKRVHGYTPITIIRESQEDRGDRIAATIRHNRARGKHQIDAMSDIIIELKKRCWSDEKIGKQLGMDADEVLRLTQITGLAEMFKDQEFSEAWEAEVLSDETPETIKEEPIKEVTKEKILENQTIQKSIFDEIKT